MPTPVTIRDVAVRAGVSVATVSRALNESGPVKAETRLRIVAAARELKYTPNSAARSLITRRTGMFGVLLPDLFGEFFSELIRGIDQAAQAQGYHLLLSSSHDHASEIETALRGMRARVDGLLVMAPMVPAAVLRAVLPERLPIVLLNSPPGPGPFDSLCIDNYSGAHDIVSHLVAHGHRRIAIINGPDGNHDAGERLRGYRAALAQAGLDGSAALEVDGDFTGSAGYHAVEALLQRSPRPTAVFAANDAMAMGALGALRDARVAVPEEIALVGFDDVSSTRYANPALSSVHVAISELGGRALARLLEVVAAGDSRVPQREMLPATPVLRRSCGCPAAPARPLRPNSDQV